MDWWQNLNISICRWRIGDGSSPIQFDVCTPQCLPAPSGIPVKVNKSKLLELNLTRTMQMPVIYYRFSWPTEYMIGVKWGRVITHNPISFDPLHDSIILTWVYHTCHHSLVYKLVYQFTIRKVGNRHFPALFSSCSCSSHEGSKKRKWKWRRK